MRKWTFAVTFLAFANVAAANDGVSAMFQLQGVISRVSLLGTYPSEQSLDKLPVSTNPSSSDLISSNLNNMVLDLEHAERQHTFSNIDVESLTMAEYPAHYATFRSGGSIYFKGKAGYLQDPDNPDLNEVDFDKLLENVSSNATVGFGAGHKFKNGSQFEIDYTISQQDISMLNIGFVF
jgi:hypothetical protein